MVYRVPVMFGDGVGPEVMAAAQQVLAATGVPIDWLEVPAGNGQLRLTATRFRMKPWPRSASTVSPSRARSPAAERRASTAAQP